MKRSRAIVSLVITVLLLGAFVFTSVWGLGNDKSGSLSSIHLGLDLAGGVSITYEVDGEENPSAEDMADTIYKLQKRVEQYSTEAQVYQEGSNRINIEIPGVSDANTILQDLGQPGNLYFVAQKDSAGNDNYTFGIMADGTIGYVLAEGKTIESIKADGGIVLEGSDVAQAAAGMQKDSTLNNQEPVVQLEFTEAGKAAFGDATTKAFANGETIGIYYDGKFISVPRVQAAITDGKAVITGESTFEDAQNLASMIRIGGLKLQLTELRSNVVGAQLGQNAIRSSIIAAIVGFALIVVFMTVIYRILGFSASIALAFYTTLEVILLSAFDMTLTLPGIAGIILSIGMAVDANVLTFARTKEELRNGSNVREAIDAGYQKALPAILDGNITTLIAAAVLYLRGSGSVKGFAETLALGIVLSMFTALFVTRRIVNIFYGLGVTNVKAYGKAKEAKIFEFAGKRKIFYLISVAVVAAGFITMGVNSANGKRAFNYSLDFVGGTSTNVTFNEAWSLADLDEQVVPKIEQAAGINEAQVQQVAGSNQVIFKTVTLDVPQRQAIENIFVNDYGISADNISAETISSTISGEMRNDATVALALALVLMLIYIWIRFRDIKFGAAAIAALAHDALVVITCYAITRLSVGSTFIAVVLTIIGYSINDTIVTFDRIRENSSNNVRKQSLAEIVNKSVSDTLSRSLFTSITTFIMVLTLFIFGVADIRSFALPLMVGVVTGTYSSIFIAANLWLDMRREKKAAKKAA